MQGYPGGAQPVYSPYPGQVPPGYQAAPQYPPAGPGAQAAVGYGQPGQPAAAPIQPSYATPAQQQPYAHPPVAPGDVDVQLPPNGTVIISIYYY